jgi:hypothetical protein
MCFLTALVTSHLHCRPHCRPHITPQCLCSRPCPTLCPLLQVRAGDCAASLGAATDTLCGLMVREIVACSGCANRREEPTSWEHQPIIRATILRATAAAAAAKAAAAKAATAKAAAAKAAAAKAAAAKAGAAKVQQMDPMIQLLAAALSLQRQTQQRCCSRCHTSNVSRCMLRCPRPLSMMQRVHIRRYIQDMCLNHRSLISQPFCCLLKIALRLTYRVAAAAAAAALLVITGGRQAAGACPPEAGGAGGLGAGSCCAQGRPAGNTQGTE